MTRIPRARQEASVNRRTVLAALVTGVVGFAAKVLIGPWTIMIVLPLGVAWVVATIAASRQGRERQR